MFGSILEETNTLMLIGVRSLKTCITRARKTPGMQGNACVEVMTTLDGNTSSLRRHIEGCVSLEVMITYAKDPLKFTPLLFRVTLTLIERILVQFCERSGMDQQTVTIDQFTTATIDQFTTVVASIKEALASLRQEINMPQTPPYLLHGHSEVFPPAVVQTTILEDTHACMDRIKQRIRQLRVSDSSTSWDELKGH
ncbi:hypothetical protein CK203_094723 [Vitis vinifera]|uniref:Uncharacterized protein n=1 Tax=Vitis vinifera TaxID=29760 RepID=A0A438EUI9_VITVI|nr:hypothetical protein CK203_094723 [Vitis vinifera]